MRKFTRCATVRRSLLFPSVTLALLSLCACGDPSAATALPDGGTSPSDAGPDFTDGGLEPTWYRDVLPIVQSSCQGCHVSGGIAPFALEQAAPTLGRKIRVETTGGQCLVEIPSWDFHWQQFYFFKTPISIPAGQARRMTCTWDNPTSRTVTWGEGTSDELCLNNVYVTL